MILLYIFQILLLDTIILFFLIFRKVFDFPFFVGIHIGHKIQYEEFKYLDLTRFETFDFFNEERNLLAC